MQNKLATIVLATLLFSGIFVVALKVSPVFAPPTVDGVISPGEYDGGMAVQLVGRWDSSWTVNADIVWDTQYLYVAVNEPVPGTTGNFWIEFAIDPNPSSTSGYLYAFAILGTHAQGLDRNPKPSDNSWAGIGTGNFSSASVSATEFKVKYTDYGISCGDTIKMSIDRSENYGSGHVAFWPQGAIVYDGSPQAQPSTWGDVHIAPSGPTTYQLTVNSVPVSGVPYTIDSTPAVTGTAITLDSGSHTITMQSIIMVGADRVNFGQWEDSSTNPVRTIDLESNTVLTATYSNHTIDGVISPGEYDGGMAVQLVGRPNWNPSWTVNAYIAWDTQYLYVAVNEPVPATTGHISWIECAIDPNPSSTSGYLYAFIIFDDHTQAYNSYLKPNGPWGKVGTGSFLVVSSTATEFRVKCTDYGFAPGDAIKMAIDRNLGPQPPPPYGQAAFWPQGAIVYDGSPQAQPMTWGDVPPQPPHPCVLTVNSSPVSGISYTVDSTAAVTGTPITLDSGSHTITMPSTITVGADHINFAHWELLSSMNPVRTIDLESDTVLTAAYSNHTMDGVISSGEYADGIHVQLAGPYPSGPYSPWTTDAYISWDTEYLYVAVNEHVPPSTGKASDSWIEFQFNTSTALHSFVLFSDGTPQHVLYPIPSGPWYWDVPPGFSNPHPWYAATNTATEFEVKYTDYGITYADLLRMSIDTGQDGPNYPSDGACAVWPNPCTFYPTANASTWGEVHLAPVLLSITPPLTTKQFGAVGKTFEVTVMADQMTDVFGFDLNITWDNALITFDHASYASNLDAMWGASNYDVTLHETGVTGSGTGYYKFVALSFGSGYAGSHALLTLGFMIQDPHTNWQKQTTLHFATAKLSDSVWQPIAHTTTDATYEISGSTPTLSLSPFTETCRKVNETFEIPIAISNCESITGFNFEIDYNTTLLDCISGTVNPTYGSGTITLDHLNGKVTCSTTGSASGSLTLVTLTFNATCNHHIWKDEATITWQNIQTSTIYMQSATLVYVSPQPNLTFTRGGSSNTINYGGDVSYTWSPIQGDVNLDGKVNLLDLRDVAFVYDQYDAYYNLVGNTNLVDLYDLVVVAGNFGFTY